MLMGGEFNVTLEAKDRPNNPNSEGFWTSISEAELHKVGPVDYWYT